MMKIQSKKSSRTMKRALALVMSLALAMSTFAVSPSVDAASTKKPKLSVKKKTLYYNKAGKKSYTLKVKKAKKVKKIKKTTWKTSKKSVVKISKKKKTSVKLTAKKAGKSTITAKVKYTRKGSKKVRKVTLKCKVTSKKWSSGTVTPTPTNGPGTVTPAPTNDPGTATPTPTNGAATDTPAAATDTPVPATNEPTATPDAAPVASKVEITKPETSTIGTKDGFNELSLTAKVYDQYDNEMTDQTVTWKSDDETIATVDNGKVTGLKNGAALIYATVNGVESVASASLKVTVDGTAPVITKAEIADYANIEVSLNEAIAAGDDAKVEVFKGASTTAETGVTAELSEDGTSLTVKKDAFTAGTYRIVLTGYKDGCGNEFAEGTNSTTIAKDASVVTKFMLDDTKTVPAMGNTRTTKVYYKVQDQYGQTLNFAQSGYTITAEAIIKETELILNGTTITPPGNDTPGYVTLPANSALVKDKTVSIKLTSTKDPVPPATEGTVVAEDTLDIVLADSTGFDVPTGFDKITAAAVDVNDVDSTSTEAAPVFKNTVISNGFNVTSTLFNNFGYNEATGRVKYVIDNTNVITFAAGAKTVTQNNGTGVPVTVVAAGTATITATLDGNADVEAKLTITVKDPALANIAVATPAAGTNNEEKTAAVSLSPAGTNLKGENLTAVLVSESEKDSVKTLEVKDDTNAGVTTTNVHVAANPNGKANTIKFVVTNGTADDLTINAGAGTVAVKSASAEKGVVVSSVITFASTPSDAVKTIKVNAFEAKEGALTVGDTAKLTYVITNKYDEDITQLKDVSTVKLTSADTAMATVPANPAVKGEIVVTGAGSGTVVIAAAYDTYADSAQVKVDPAKKITKITLVSEDPNYIYGDTDPAYVTITAESQYAGFAYPLKAADFASNITMTATDLQVTPVGAGSDGKPEASEATGEKEIKFLAVKNDLGLASSAVTTNVEKEIKLVKKGAGDFADVTQKVTLKPARANKDMAVSVDSLTALVDVESSESVLTLKDQYGAEIKTFPAGDIKEAVKVVNNDGTLADSSAVTTTVSAYDSTKKGYPVKVSADAAGTYKVTLFTGAGSAPAANDPQVTITFTAGTAANLVKEIEFTGFVGGKELAKVDYIKVGTTATALTPKFRAKDANGNVIAGVDESLAGAIWYYTPSADFTASAIEQTVTASAAEKTGSVKISVVYEGVRAETEVRVSSTAPKAKDGTYVIYDKVDSASPKTDIKTGSVRFTEEDIATLQVYATDQYGDVYQVKDFYGIDSSDEHFATAVQTPGTNEIVISKVTPGAAGKANIDVYITETLKYTINATAIEDLVIALTVGNCTAQGYGTAPVVTVAGGVATVETKAQWHQSAKITVAVPEGTSITDYGYLTFKVQAVDADITASYKTFDMEMQGGQWLQGIGNPSSTGNILIGKSANIGGADPSNGKIAADMAATISIPLDWSHKDEIKSDLTGSVQFVIGTHGIDTGSKYTISEVTLKG